MTERTAYLEKKKMATPLEIEIALHYWTHTTDYGDGNGDNNFNAPAVVKQREQMVRAGLLAAGDLLRERQFSRGPALECYIEALCAVPWPKQQWSISEARGQP